MSGIKFNNTNVCDNCGSPTLRSLKVGDTFRFLWGDATSVYMKVSDERHERINGNNIFEEEYRDAYVSLSTGQVYRPSNSGIKVKRVSVHAETAVGF